MTVYKAMILTGLFFVQASVAIAGPKYNPGYGEYSPGQSRAAQDYKAWQSGSGIADVYKPRFIHAGNKGPHESAGNPWKPNGFGSRNFAGGQERPWGNVPGPSSKPSKGMRYYDEQFKQWSKQLDADYARSLFNSGNRGYPGGLGLHRPFGLYPFGLYPGSVWSGQDYAVPPYTAYPGSVYPYDGYYRKPGGIPGVMRDFMPW